MRRTKEEMDEILKLTTFLVFELKLPYERVIKILTKESFKYFPCNIRTIERYVSKIKEKEGFI